MIAKLKETKVKRNLYYEIKDRVIEEVIEKNRIIRKSKKTKVFGLQSTKDVRENLIELLTERVRHHKDKFISPTIYQELRGLEVKKNGKIEHSDLTHDDQIFSYLMAMYVWYEGKDLRENFGIMKSGIKTEEAVDDIIDLVGTEEMSDITESISYINKPDQDKMTLQMQQMQKAQGVLFSDFVNKQRKAEEDKLGILLQNPAFKNAYAKKYNIHPDAISTGGQAYGDMVNIPSSLFLDFNKPEEEIDQNSVYYTLNQQVNPNTIDFPEDESLQ